MTMRQRDAYHRADMEEAGHRAVRPDGGVDAQRHPDQQGRHGGDQDQLEGGREALGDECADFLLVAVGNAELALGRIANEGGELHHRRLVQPQPLAQLVALDLGRLRVQHQLHRIAQEAEDHEGDERHGQHDQRRVAEVSQDQNQHRPRLQGKDGPATRPARRHHCIMVSQ